MDIVYCTFYFLRNHFFFRGVFILKEPIVYCRTFTAWVIQWKEEILAVGVTPAAQEDLMVLVRCQRQSAQIVVVNVKFLLNQQRAGPSIAVTVSQSTGHPGSKYFFTLIGSQFQWSKYVHQFTAHFNADWYDLPKTQMIRSLKLYQVIWVIIVYSFLHFY